MVSFRLSPEEYERFQGICSTQGVRSISDLARTALQKLIPGKAQADPLWLEVGDLRKQIRALSHEVDRLSGILESRDNKPGG